MKKILYILTFLPFCLSAQNKNGVAKVGGSSGNTTINNLNPDGNGMFDLSNLVASIETDTAYLYKDLSYILGNNKLSFLNMDNGRFEILEGSVFTTSTSGLILNKGFYALSVGDASIQNNAVRTAISYRSDIFAVNVTRSTFEHGAFGYDFSIFNIQDGWSFQERYENAIDEYSLSSSNLSTYNSFNDIHNVLITPDESVYFGVADGANEGDSTGVQMPVFNARQMGLISGNYFWQVDENGRNGVWQTPSSGGTADGNNFVTGGVFNSTTGQLNLTRIGLSDVNITGFPTNADLIEENEGIAEVTVQSDLGTATTMKDSLTTMTFTGASQGGVQYLLFNHFGNSTGATVEAEINESLFDLDNTNEIQTLSFVNDTLTLSGSNSVVLPKIRSGTKAGNGNSGDVFINIYDENNFLLGNSIAYNMNYTVIDNVVNIHGKCTLAGNNSAGGNNLNKVVIVGIGGFLGKLVQTSSGVCTLRLDGELSTGNQYTTLSEKTGVVQQQPIGVINSGDNISIHFNGDLPTDSIISFSISFLGADL